VRKILNILLFFLPLPFLASHYVIVADYSGLSYILKHVTVISVLIVALIVHVPFNRIRYYRAYFTISLALFISYLFINYILISKINIINSFYLLSYVVLFVYTYLLGRMKDALKLLLYPYYGLLLLLIITILTSIIFDVNLYSTWGMIDSTVLRKRWTFGYFHPGYFASFVMILGVLAHVLIKRELLSNLNYLVVIASLVLIYLSGTRNSFISYLIFLLISHSRASFRMMKAGFVLVAAIISIMLFNSWGLINSLSSGRLSTWLTHLVYNGDSFNFLVGTGLGNAKRIEFASNWVGESEHDIVFHVDNFYFEIFMQFGIIGLFLFFGVILSLFVSIKKSGLKGYNSRVLKALLLSLMFFGFFDSAFLSTGNLVPVLLWTIFFIQLNIENSGCVVETDSTN